MSKILSVSIGIIAHNEEQNILGALDSIAKQELEVARIVEILVISSGSYDRTNDFVRRRAKKDPRIRLIEQFKRQGKSSAVNVFLRKAKASILIEASGDLRLHRRAIEEITLPFLHPKVGMVGSHPIPINTGKSALGQEVRILWQLHHLVSLIEPKCGEMIAFRNVIRAIPKTSAMDEATLEVLLKLVGYKVVYAPQSVVYNKGPKTIQDFVTQQRRNYTGHLLIKQRYQYNVATNNRGILLQAGVQFIRESPHSLLPLARLFLLQLYCRIMGWVDFYVLGRNPYKWKMIDRS